MRRMASRRAAVTWPSFSSMAFCRAGGIARSSTGWSPGRLELDSPFLDDRSDLAAHTSGAAQSANPSSNAVAARLFVVVVLIGPVLALEGPVLLVVAHEPLELE